MSTSFESVCVWTVHIKYQMLPWGRDLIMIIGSKLQNKCSKFKQRPSPASSEDLMTLQHTPQAQCDIHTQQTGGQQYQPLFVASCPRPLLPQKHPDVFSLCRIPKILHWNHVWDSHWVSPFIIYQGKMSLLTVKVRLRCRSNLNLLLNCQRNQTQARLFIYIYMNMATKTLWVWQQFFGVPSERHDISVSVACAVQQSWQMRDIE